jgi:integrase
MDEITYDVRLYKTEIYKGQKYNTYTVRWKVAGQTWREPFRNKAQADSFRSSLAVAARKGEAFSVETGRPVSWKRQENAISWYAFTLTYMDAKWPYASPGHRRCMAEALTDATEALVPADKSAPSKDAIRAALRGWSYSARITSGGDEPPGEFTDVLRWLERNSASMTEFSPEKNGPVVARRVLERLSRKQDGKAAAPSTATRKRMTFNNALEYACEIGILPGNPLKRVKWTLPKVATTLDLRVVVNAEQAARLLAATRAQKGKGERLEAFFALMYYAALRPEEAIDLRHENLAELPEQGWGKLWLSAAEPSPGRRWTDSGKPRVRRPLKHRADGDIRPVPLHPDVVAILRRHLAQPGWSQPGPQGRVFIGPRGGVASDTTYLAVFKQARAAAFTKAEAASPLARRPYELRHAAVSTWLAAGVPAAQVAEWAGHSVAVLLKVYAKCVAGQEEDAKRRIIEATQPRTE